MKKKILLSIGVLSISMLAAVCSSKSVKDVKAEEQLVADEDWQTYAGDTKNYIANETETLISPLTSYGQHGAYKSKVHLDGLKVTYRAEKLPPQSTCSGIYLSSTPQAYLGFPTISMWKGLYNNQTRVNVGEDHNTGKDCFAYSKPSLTAEKTFGLAASMVMQTSNTIKHAGFNVLFEKYNDEWYSMKFTAVYSDSYIWTNMGVTYDANTKSCTVYAPISELTVLDSNGDCYLNYFGFDTNAVYSGYTPYISFEDDYKRTYQNEKVAPVEKKLDAYVQRMASAASVDDFKAALALREEYLNSLSELRKHDQYVYATMKLKEADSSVSANAAKYASEEIQSKLDICEADVNSFMSNEALITDSAIESLTTKINDAKAIFESYYNLVGASAQESYAQNIATLEENNEYFKCVKWVVALEKAVSDLSSSQNIGRDIDAVSETIENDSCRAIIETLSDAHKTAINRRIQDAKVNFEKAKSENRRKLVTYYLGELTKYINNGLSTKDSLSAAIDYLAYINRKVAINGSLGALYNEYASKRNIILDASDAYIQSQIAKIDELYQENITKIEDYEAIKAAYNEFDYAYFAFEDSENYVELNEKYVELTNKVKGNNLYFFDANGVNNVQQGKNGIYFDSVGSYPARINYNQALSIQEGISVTIRSEEMAFYNDGARANNLSINFLNENNSYKGMSIGLNVVIWLYEATSMVRVYNMVDGEIASFTINTPKHGEDYIINLSQAGEGDNLEYVLDVNGNSTSIKRSFLLQCGIDLHDEVYFSMGSFLDDTTYANTFSIVKINDHTFALPKEEIERNDYEAPKPDEDKPTEPGDVTSASTSVSTSTPSSDSTTKPADNKGCNGSVTASLLGVSIALIGLSLLRKKKEEN